MLFYFEIRPDVFSILTVHNIISCWSVVKLSDFQLFYDLQRRKRHHDLVPSWVWHQISALTQAYIIHNATLPLSDITGGGLPDDMQLPLESQKTLNYFVHICSKTPQDHNFKHTLHRMKTFLKEQFTQN